MRFIAVVTDWWRGSCTQIAVHLHRSTLYSWRPLSNSKIVLCNIVFPIPQCSVDCRRELSENIVLVGGTASIIGLWLVGEHHSMYGLMLHISSVVNDQPALKWIYIGLVQTGLFKIDPLNVSWVMYTEHTCYRWTTPGISHRGHTTLSHNINKRILSTTKHRL